MSVTHEIMIDSSSVIATCNNTTTTTSTPPPQPLPDLNGNGNGESASVTSTSTSSLNDLTSSSAAAALAKQQPITSESYLDNSGVNSEQFIKKTLAENPRDRLFMLNIEKNLTTFLADEK